MVRSPYTDKSGLKKGAWSEEEDNKLRAYVQRFGHWNWRQLPKYAGLSRCGKSCRLRWLNYLRPDVKRGNYSVVEEDLIIKLQKQFGNRWSAIAARLPGRTDNEIKNYWHTRLRKRIEQDSQSFEEMEQFSEMSKRMDDADQNEHSSEMSSFDPEQKTEIMEPEHPAAASGNADSSISSLSCDSTLFDGIDKFEEDSNSSLKSFTEPFESFWTQSFALDASHDSNNHWLPSVEEEFVNPFPYFLHDDINWFHESIQESLFQKIDSNFV